MDLDLLLSRVQFAFTISFHIMSPAFTIGLAAWLETMEGMHLATGDAVYRLQRCSPFLRNDYGPVDLSLANHRCVHRHRDLGVRPQA
jgi:hypothetical protein